MPRPKKPVVASRKQPSQARSKQMVADILEASIRVLKRDGGHKFNTIRVAQAAGVSVGSLYQYFPNKAALLCRLQLDEWETTSQLLERHLGDQSVPPEARLRAMIIDFFRTELEESALRRALDDASELFRDSPEAKRQRAKSLSFAQAFFAEALPAQSKNDVAFSAQFFIVCLGAIAEKVTDESLSARELGRWANATADLLCSHLRQMTAGVFSRIE